MTINELFGIRIKERRIKLNLSQEKLANLADVDRTYLPDIEKGKRNISLAVAERIATALEVSLSILIKRDNE